MKIGRTAFKVQYAPLLSTVSLLDKAVKLSDSAKVNLGWNKDKLEDVSWTIKFHEQHNEMTARQKRENGELKREKAKSATAVKKKRRKMR
jgi:hypothetical protein